MICPVCHGEVVYQGFSSVECLTLRCPNYCGWERDPGTIECNTTEEDQALLFRGERIMDPHDSALRPLDQPF